MQRFPARDNTIWVTALVVLSFWAAQALGQAGAAKNDKPAKPEPTYKFEMRGKSWSRVLEWLSEETGLPVITTTKPPGGTFDVISPGGPTKQYTMPEIIDMINQGLLSQKYLLIHRSGSFNVVPSDEIIDPSIVPRIRVDDLNKYGRTELVSVVLPLNALVAEDVAGEVKLMLGPFGTVSSLAKANLLLIQDTAGNIERVYKTIRESEENEKGQSENYTYKCNYVKARDAERVLKELLGDPLQLARMQQPQPGPGGGQPGAGAARQAQQVVVLPKLRMHYVSADERNNTVLVTGPADKIALAKKILSEYDKPQKDQLPVVVGPPTVKTYTVPGGNAEALAKALQENYKTSNTVRISAAPGSSTIVVLAGPEDQKEIALQITGSADKTGKTELIKLTTLDSGEVVTTLKGMFGDPKTGGPYLKEDSVNNAVIVKGTAEQVTDVQAAIRALGEKEGPAGNMRVITLDKASAATLAEALERLLPQLRSNPVKVITPGAASQKIEHIKEPEPEPGQGHSEEQEQPPAKGQPPAPPEKKAANDKPGRKDVPIHIIPSGNRLIVTSDDQEALQMVQELVRLLTKAPGGETDFEYIKLKNASATEAARILDEAFNGPKPQQQTTGAQPGAAQPGAAAGQQQQARFFGQFAAEGATPPGTPRRDRIRVVASPATNALLVRASQLDMLNIRRLLDKAIDIQDKDSRAQTRTWILPLRYASAPQVANVIKDVYREQVNNNPRNVSVGGFPGFAFGGAVGGQQQGGHPVDANFTTRPVTLSVGVDDATNRLILSCNEDLYEEIKKLVTELDNAAKDSARTVRVIAIKGIDPMVIQQAIDAIQGHRQGTTRQGTATTPGGNYPQSVVPIGPGVRPLAPGGASPGGESPRPRPSGGGQPPLSRAGGGPDFFADRVTDDPRTALLYDPQHLLGDDSTLPLAGAEEQEQAPPPPAEGAIRAPRSPVTADALEQLGVIVITGNNQQDVDEVVKIIEYIQKLGATAEVQLQLVPLQFADATSVANTLAQVYSKVIVGAAANVRAPFSGSSGTPGTPGTAAAAGQQQLQSSVVFVPVPRFNAILVAAPKSRIDDIIQEIKRLDKPTSPQGQATPFPLTKASAARVANLLTSFYAQRYPNEGSAQNQVRITHDDTTNTVFVQAGPNDMQEIRDLIWRMDNTVSNAINDLRIVTLNAALSDDVASLLLQAIAQGLVPASTTGAAGIFPSPAGLPGARPPGALGTAQPGVAPTTVPGAPGQPGTATKTTSLRFISNHPGSPRIVESGLLDDIHITSDPRTNSLIISAPARTMELLLALTRELDVLPAARAKVNIFPLCKADATDVATTLQQLFQGTTSGQQQSRATGTVGGAGGAAVTGASAGTGTFTGTGGSQRPVFTLGGTLPDGTPITELRLAIDVRTNSLIAAGSANDLQVIEAIVSRLEDSDIAGRHNEVYHLRNIDAADAATALQNFLTKSLQVLSQGQQLTAYQEIQRDIVVVPEPISNTLLISATPHYYEDLVRIIQEIDEQPPQVVIQVLVAEVDLSGSEEFGVEIGLQTPVLFDRGIIPLNTAALGPNGSITYTNPGLVPQGVTVNTSANPSALPGFGFNSTGPLGNNPLANPSLVGFQGLTNLGTGRASPTSGIGGFVFSAASNTFNLLIRALKTQGRVDILSRPQIMTMDNQTSSILIGQSFPFIANTTIGTLGNVVNTVQYRNIGIQLQVTPRISPDGSVLMRVQPEISSVSATQINLGNNVLATAFNVQQVATTVAAMDGETVAIGGLITKKDTVTENKYPWLGDLPYLGALFRYRTKTNDKTELLVILTPHIVRTPKQADEILAAEAKRMEWVLGDVVKIHGTTGLEPILPPPPVEPADGFVAPDVPGVVTFPPAGPAEVAPGVPFLSQGSLTPTLPPVAAPVPEMLPPPNPAPALPSGPASPGPPPAGSGTSPLAPAQPGAVQNGSVGQGRENGTWNWYRHK